MNCLIYVPCLIAVNYVIGIDLGTTNSYFGYFHNNQIKLIEDEYGCHAFPSVVAFTEKGRFVGNSAKRVSHKYLKTFIYGEYYVVRNN